MRQLIIVLIQMIVFSVNSYCQDHSSYTLLTLDDSMSFRLKRVELSANRLFGAEITQEKYFLFEFPNDTSTLLIFANRIRKQRVKNWKTREIQLSQICPEIIKNNIILSYKNKYYKTCTKPNSLNSNQLFFTKNDNIFIKGKIYTFIGKNEGDFVYQYYDYKYGYPQGEKRLKFEIAIETVLKNEYTVNTLTYDNDFNPSDFVYKKGEGIMRIFGYQYSIDVIKEIKTEL